MKQHISTPQMAFLLYNAIVPTAILVVPNVVLSHSHQDSWISLLESLVLGLGIAAMVGFLASKNPGLPFPAWMRSRFGLVAGTIIGVLLTQYYISISSVILGEFTNILTDQILLDTPAPVLKALIMAVTCFAVFHGIEVIARVNAIVTCITLTAYTLSFLMFINLIDLQQFQPVMDHKASEIAYGGLLPLGWLSEIALVLVLASYLKKPQGATKAAIWSVTLSGTHLIITVMLCISVFGPNLPEQFRYPSFSMIEIIKLGATLERIDILFVSFWLCTIYTKMMLFLFGAYHCLVTTFNLRPSKPLLLSLALVILLTSTVSMKEQANFDRNSQHVTPYELIAINVLLPAFVGIGLLLVRKRPQKGGV